ncbi:MAG: hypothetical protein HY074_08105 [Deltaproteobacteria bacterium]|nr:hypothetical protein [Deltaproteobacteria bacterium]
MKQWLAKARLGLFLTICMETATLAAHTDRIVRVEGGWYDATFPVPVMHLEGSIEDVARAHGAILAKLPEAKETLRYFGSVFDNRVAHNATLENLPLARTFIRWAYRHLVRNLMIDFVPDRYRAAYAEFAKAAGLDEDEVWDALVLPDAGLRVASLLYGTELSPLLPPSFGCTSIIWNSGHSSVLHGRNLDYDGVGYWDRHAVVIHVIPNEGLAYVSVTALGIHAPGITAFNEAGLTLAVHQLTLEDTQSSGTPVAITSAEVIRNSRSIDDAIQIIRGMPRAAGWAYVLSQGRDRAVIETSASEVAIRRSSEPFFYQTNHVSSPALASHQIFFSPGGWLDSFSRASRLARLAQSGATTGWATPDRLAPMLGMGRVANEVSPPHRVAGGTIARLDNIQSVIMDASHRRLWVGVGSEKRAPNENTYVEYRWADLRSADEPELTEAEITLLPEDVLGASGVKLRELLRQGANKKHAAQNPGERVSLLGEYVQQTNDAAKSAPSLPGRWPGVYLHVWEELRSGALAGHALKSLLRDLNDALKDPGLVVPPTNGSNEVSRAVVHHHIALGRFTRARLLDLLGRRPEALYEYYVVQRTAEFERLKVAASYGLRHPFDWNQAHRLAVDFAGIDLFQY